MLQAARAIGSQLGRFLHRQQALDALRRNEARFRRLTELSTDWYWELDRDFRFTEYAGTGVLDTQEVLGKTLWELPNLVVGSADWAVHRAQLGERWSFCDFEFSALRADGQPGYYSISGEPMFDETGTFAGYWGTGLDITRRKRAEMAPHEGEARPRVHTPDR
jgi:PAS domain S-box-containing protein